MDDAVESDARHDMNEETEICRLVGPPILKGLNAYLVTLSNEWNTSEFLHMAMAIALFPNDRQYELMNNLFEPGKTQMVSMSRRLTK